MNIEYLFIIHGSIRKYGCTFYADLSCVSVKALIEGNDIKTM